MKRKHLILKLVLYFIAILFLAAVFGALIQDYMALKYNYERHEHVIVPAEKVYPEEAGREQKVDIEL